MLDALINDWRARWVAWSLVALYLVLALAGLSLQFVAQRYYRGFSPGYVAGFSLAVALASGTGAFIAMRRPRLPMGWIILAIPLTWGAGLFAAGYVNYDVVVHPGSLPAARLALLWLTARGSVLSLVAITLLFLLFPDGRPLSPRWGYFARIATFAALASLFLEAQEPGPIEAIPSLMNPFAMDESSWKILGPLKDAARATVILSVLAGAISLVIRLHRAKGEERQQIKWFAFAAVLFPVSLPLFEFAGPRYLWIAQVLTSLVVVAFPVAVAFAILKYRLYDIDVIINRTLLYGTLSVLLGAAYFAIVVILQELLQALAGQGQSVAIVISTLAIAALFSPLRNRLQSAIDRSFYRARYDAQRSVARLGERLRDQHDIGGIESSLIHAVVETVQPSSLSLWLKEGRNERSS